MAKNFSSFARDDNRIPILTGTGILTADITASPKNSPLSIDTNVVTFAIPTNAAEMVVLSDVAIRIGEAVAVSTYFKLPANTILALPLSGVDNIYLRTDSGSGTLQFYFVTV